MALQRGSPGYAGSADGSFAQAVLNIGTQAFPRTLLSAVKRIADVDHCTVFGFQSVPSARSLLDIGSITIGKYLGEAYSGRFHQSDPNRDIILGHRKDRAAIVLPTFERRMYSRDYRRIFFDDAEILDKFAVAIWCNDVCFYASFYRTARSGCFNAHQIGRLRQVSPLIAAAILRHFEQERAAIRPSPICILQQAMAADPAFQHLTAREKEVCIPILLGYSSEAISDRLQISIHSTITYRKRAYEKLQISSQNELFGMILRALAVGQQGSRWDRRHIDVLVRADLEHDVTGNRRRCSSQDK